MRFVLELFRTDGRVEGSVGQDGVQATSASFSGWLELLRLLETSLLPSPSPAQDADHE